MSSASTSLIRRIERHCRAQSIAETTFGRHAVNDGKLVGRLRNGKSITLRTLGRIEAAIKQARHAPPPAPDEGTGAGT
jgi:hypothetical protein